MYAYSGLSISELSIHNYAYIYFRLLVSQLCMHNFGRNNLEVLSFFFVYSGFSNPKLFPDLKKKLETYLEQLLWCRVVTHGEQLWWQRLLDGRKGSNCGDGGKESNCGSIGFQTEVPRRQLQDIWKKVGADRKIGVQEAISYLVNPSKPRQKIQ